MTFPLCIISIERFGEGRLLDLSPTSRGHVGEEPRPSISANRTRSAGDSHPFFHDARGVDLDYLFNGPEFEGDLLVLMGLKKASLVNASALDTRNQ